MSAWPMKGALGLSFATSIGVVGGTDHILSGSSIGWARLFIFLSKRCSLNETKVIT
jgi:hypothetical protein